MAEPDRVNTFYWERMAKEVYITGDFDGWKKDVNKMEQKMDGTFFKHVELPNSLGTTIRYIFIVDGQLMPDPDKNIDSDGNGMAVNVLTSTLRIPQLSSGTTTRNLTAAFTAQYRELCKIYNEGDLKTAIDRASKLDQEAALPVAIRAACCCVLATNDTDYTRFAQEAVEIYTSMQSAHPTNPAIQKLLADAERLLHDAEHDDAKQKQVLLRLQQAKSTVRKRR